MLSGQLNAATTSPVGTHFKPRAKRTIQLFMNGGPFQADFFDPKPALKKYAGQRPKGATLRTERVTGGLLPSPFEYAREITMDEERTLVSPWGALSIWNAVSQVHWSDHGLSTYWDDGKSPFIRKVPSEFVTVSKCS